MSILKSWPILILFSAQITLAESTKKVLMILNDGFQVDEYFIPRKTFEIKKFNITTASKYGGIVNPGRKYINDYKPITSDLSFEQIKVNDYDIITFTGGSGAWTDYFPNKTLHQILLRATKNKKIIVGLICAGTGLLATADNLDGSSPQFKNRNVTGYNEVSGLLKLQGQVNYSTGDLNKPYVVIDENLVTGRDPKSSQLFADTIIKKVNQN